MICPPTFEQLVAFSPSVEEAFLVREAKKIGDPVTDHFLCSRTHILFCNYSSGLTRDSTHTFQGLLPILKFLFLFWLLLPATEAWSFSFDFRCLELSRKVMLLVTLKVTLHVGIVFWSFLLKASYLITSSTLWSCLFPFPVFT